MKKLAGLVVAGFLLSGCMGASGQGELKLTSVLADHQQRVARKQQEAALSKEQQEKFAAEVKEQLKKSKSDPPEIDLLELPKPFVKLSGKRLERYPYKAGLPPFTQVLWRYPGGKLRVMGGKAELKFPAGQQISREKFNSELRRVSRVYENLYDQRRGSQTDVSIVPDDSVIRMTISNHFFENETDYWEKRYFFIYRPEYRFNVFVSGDGKTFNGVSLKLKKALDDFDNKLSAAFPDGISFDSEAQTFYAVQTYSANPNLENTRLKRVVKLYEKEACPKLLEETAAGFRGWRLEDANCFEGGETEPSSNRTYDESYSGYFQKTDRPELYLRYTEKSGYEALLYFPGAPVDDAASLLHSFAVDLKKENAADLDFFYPDPKRTKSGDEDGIVIPAPKDV